MVLQVSSMLPKCSVAHDQCYLGMTGVHAAADKAASCCCLVSLSPYPCRFAAESFTTGPSNTPLPTKLLSMLQDCIFAHLFPELQRRVEKLSSAVTPPARALLRKGRR
jgi:hypothetical protein